MKDEMVKEEINKEPTEEKNIKKQSKEKKKLSKKTKIIIAILSVLIVGSILSYFLIFNKNKKTTPKEIKTTEYTTKKAKENIFGLYCYTNTDETGIKKVKTIKAGETVICTLYNTEDSESLTGLSFDLDLGSSLELVDAVVDDSYEKVKSDKPTKFGEIKITDKKVNVKFDEPIDKIDKKVKLVFTAKDNKVKNSVLNISNIETINTDNEKILLINNDLSFNKQEGNNEIFIYSDEEDGLWGTTYKYDGEEPIDSILCDTNNCETLDNEENYLLYYDDQIYLYNIKNQKTTKTSLEYDENNSYYLITKNNSVKWIITNNYEESRSSLYDESYKIIKDISNSEDGIDSIIYDYTNKYFKIYNEKTKVYNMYDINLSTYKAPTDRLLQIGNSNYYELEQGYSPYDCGCGEYSEGVGTDAIFDEKGNALFDGVLFLDHKINDQNELTVRTKTGIYTYDNEQKLIKKIDNADAIISINYYLMQKDSVYTVYDYETDQEILIYNLSDKKDYKLYYYYEYQGFLDGKVNHDIYLEFENDDDYIIYEYDLINKISSYR